MMLLKKLLYWLIAGSRGGHNRARIIMFISKHPANAKRIADGLEIDYKTALHHLGVLLKHGLLDCIGEGYGKAYALSPEMEGMLDEVRRFLEKAR